MTPMKIRARHIPCEPSNPCHGHEWSMPRSRKSRIPGGNVLALGYAKPAAHAKSAALASQRV